jgi:hypothetical protein
MLTELEQYLNRVKIICSDPNNETREKVTDELLKQITSQSFISIIDQVFTSNLVQIDPSIKIVTCSLLKDYIKTNIRALEYTETQQLIFSILNLMCSEMTTIEMKEVLSDSLSIPITRASSRMVN